MNQYKTDIEKMVDSALDNKSPRVCPVNHGKPVEVTPGVCPVNHSKPVEVIPDVCPVNHGKPSDEEIKPAVCPVNHGKPVEVTPGVCPVNHSKPSDEKIKPAVCPVNHTNIPIAEGTIDKNAAPGVCPVSTKPNPNMGSHFSNLNNFVGKTYVGTSKEPKNDTGDRLVDPNAGTQFFQGEFHDGYDPSKIEYADLVPGGLIPAAGRGNSEDGAHWVNPTPMQLFRAIRRKEMDIQEEDALEVAFTHATVVDFTWQLIEEYEGKYRQQCPNIALKRFEGKYGQHTMKSWLTEKAFGLTPYDRHDWWIDRCGTEVRYL
jgi:hypothetical protein